MLRLRVPAKLNLALDVLSLRPDGYHEIQTVMQAVSIYDELVLRRRSERGVTLSSTLPFLPLDARNLAYRAADVVVSRAGASTISELQLVGAPAILVPSPNVAEDHQRKNAEALAKRDAAIMILDRDCRTSLLEAVTALLRDKKRRDTLSANVKAMAMENSDERIVDELIQLTTDK